MDCVAEAEADGEAREGVERIPLTSGILQSVRIVFRAIQAHSRAVEASCGIGDSKLWLLWEISRSPAVGVSQLARSLGVHVSTCSNLLDSLQKHGLIARDRGARDQRQVQVRLTPAGERLLAGAPRPVQGALNAALARMSLEQLQGLHGSLALLVNQLGGGRAAHGQVPLGEIMTGEKL